MTVSEKLGINWNEKLKCYEMTEIALDWFYKECN